MDDAELVSRFECFGDLPGHRHEIGRRDRTSRNEDGEVLPLDQFHDQCAGAARPRARRRELLEAVDLGDVRMIEGRQRLRFAGESRQPIRVGGKQVRQPLSATVRFSFVSRAR